MGLELDAKREEPEDDPVDEGDEDPPKRLDSGEEEAPEFLSGPKKLESPEMIDDEEEEGGSLLESDNPNA
jgi:hypothetical protein